MTKQSGALGSIPAPLTAALTPMPPSPPDLPRATLGVLFIATLIVGSLWILQPFLGPGIWAANRKPRSATGWPGATMC